ncbi:hypothetical protein AX16_010074 [Volvariella volvacea WC 439]|nr:hypothetical protein AX16_010074 [Volvariella volvacea WC 439]
MRLFRRLISDTFHRRIGGPPMTWYGAEFSQEDLPYSLEATKKLSITHPSKPFEIHSERAFWTVHIPNYELKFPGTPSRDFIPEFTFPEYFDSYVLPSGQINSLPDEVLRCIFGFAAVPASSIGLGEELHPQPRVNYRLDLNPLFLGQVCSTWRGIVCRMPTLWSTIRLYMPGVSQARLAELYLIRSGPTTPLTLSVKYPWGVRMVEEGGLRIALSAFVDHIHRWRGINLEIPSIENNPLLDRNRVKPGAARMLEILHLGIDGSEYPGFDEIISTLSTSPALKDIGVWGLKSLKTFKFWSRLTHLQIAQSTPLMFTPVLPLLQELQVLRYEYGYIPGPGPRIDRNVGPVLLPKLHTLEFDSGQVPNIIAYITTPALKTIHLVYPLEVHDPDMIDFDEFLERSQCNITSFTISASDSWSPLEEEPVVKYLTMSGLQNVERLKIKANVGNVVIALLAMGLFPSLKELMLTRCETSDGLGSAMVQKRMQGDGRLGRTLVEVVKIRFVECKNPFDKARIRDMRKKGYKIETMACANYIFCSSGIDNLLLGF